LSQSRRNKSVVTLAIGIGGLFLFNGCAGLSPLPDEERYQFINQVKDGLDYASAGEVIEERYDNGMEYFLLHHSMLKLRATKHLLFYLKGFKVYLMWIALL
jgi:hypothetical protein